MERDGGGTTYVERGGSGVGGVIIGIAVLALVAIVAFFLLSANRNDAGQITEEGSVSSFDLKAGDCLNGLAESNNITSVPAVPCAQPHDGEVFATFEIPAGTWPGDAEVAKQARAREMEARLA